MKVAHIITGLNNGGAEAMLYNLCRFLPADRHLVISLLDDGKYGPMLRELGVEVVCLGNVRGRFRWRGFARISDALRRFQPDAVQTWMYHGDLIGGLAAWCSGFRNICWGIHHATLDWKGSSTMTFFVRGACALASYIVPRRILCCSKASVASHHFTGYCRRKLQFVPNGCDLDRFKPDPAARSAVRRRLGIGEETPLLGLVARFDPQKNHRGLIGALALLRDRGREFRCALIGPGVDANNSELSRWIREADLADRILPLGPQDAVSDYLNALDIFVLPSTTEGFPNVLNEAMACGTPCVTTPAGDAAYIVGDTGWVTSSATAKDISDKIEQALDSLGSPEFATLKRAARQRIVDNFAIEKVAATYRQAWEQQRRKGWCSLFIF